MLLFDCLSLPKEGQHMVKGNTAVEKQMPLAIMCMCMLKLFYYTL